MVLVTGGTGFLGAYIIKELVDTGHAVRAIRRSNAYPLFIPKEIIDRVEWIPGDILDTIALEEAMEGAETVIHAAAKISFAGNERRQMFKTNIEGTANVVNIALEKKIKKLVYISSVSALGRSANGKSINEGKQWEETRLNTNYAISKYHAEMEVWRAIGEGLNAVIVNPSTIIGYGDWNTSSCAIFKNTYNQFPWYTNGVNGFVDVQDVARVVVLLLESSVSAERFVINGDNWSFRQLFNSIADGFSKKHPTKEATPFLGSIAWRLEKLKTLFTGKHALLTRETARIAQSSTYFDNSKIKQRLPGFAFTPLQQTIEQACMAYLKNPQSV
jgi:nucleoside-diphosphate-sugar epimerase